LEALPSPKQQPNLFLSAANHLGGIRPDYDAFRSFVSSHLDDVLELVHSRSTQTNEIGRCATLLPALGLLPPPLALIEVGASAGLNLLLEDYRYDYGDGRVLGDTSSGVVIPCRLCNDVPLPDRVPEVSWRRGIDLNPIDVNDPEATRWLESCVFFDHFDRRERLTAAIASARTHPPEIVQGDLVEEIAAVVADAPKGATMVVFHSAVLAYLERERREVFADVVRDLDVVWLSNEGPSVVRSLKTALDRPLPEEVCFVLGRDGREPLAFTHPHGRWIEWLGESAATG
jgi:hypothetical protein